MLLVLESAWKSTCHSTNIFYPGIETKIFCYLECFSFILSMFSNTVVSRKNRWFQTLTFVFKQWLTKCINSAEFQFLAFWSMEYSASDDAKFTIMSHFRWIVFSRFIQCPVGKNRSPDVKYNSCFGGKFLVECPLENGPEHFFPKSPRSGLFF